MQQYFVDNLIRTFYTQIEDTYKVQYYDNAMQNKMVNNQGKLSNTITCCRPPCYIHLVRLYINLSDTVRDTVKDKVFHLPVLS